MAASETREFKHIYQICKRDSGLLVFEKLLTYVNRGQTPANISLKYP